MPTDLPLNPNLEHLKKQAKTLLDDFRLKKPEAVARFGMLSLKDTPKLADAQRLIAREYGFENWAKLKTHVESIISRAEAVPLANKALQNDDVAGFRQLLNRCPELRAGINDPVSHFNSPLINHVRSEEMLEVLLEAGADINARSRWWAGGFGLLDQAEPALASRAIQRGAVVTVHAAARLDMIDRLRELIAADPALVRARGGDGQTPLHFASTIEIADYLLDHGADIDARDVDHESTPAQYMVRSRPEIARHLIRRGAKSDILMAAALGDLNLVQKHLRDDPECIRMRVDNECFPKTRFHSGGTIYQWELGWHVSACQVAKAFGHPEVFNLLMERCPDDEKLLNACWVHDEAMVKSLLAANPNLASSLSASGRRQLAHAARNNDPVAAGLMLTAGLPVESFGQHHATPLHWAAWHGQAELVRMILARGASIENSDNDYKVTPLNWAVHGSENGWYKEKGDYPATVEILLDAGARLPDQLGGTSAVREVLRRHGLK
jgi:ankyrin repeat protein